MSQERELYKNVVIKALCDITGKCYEELLEESREGVFVVDSRDYEELISRLEAMFDCTLDRNEAQRNNIDINYLASRIDRILNYD